MKALSKKRPSKAQEKTTGIGKGNPSKDVLTPEMKKWLKVQFGERVKWNEPMSRHTSFRVGGAADAFLSLRGIRELKTLTAFCREKEIPCFVLGDGTNLLVTDAGVRGVVITLSDGFRKIKIVQDEGSVVTVRAMAGARTRMLCRFAIQKGLAGMNFAVGIPGTVGGAIVMNAGSPRGCMADVVEAVEGFCPDGRIRTYPRNALDFDYRGLKWAPGADATPPILLSGLFRLLRTDPESLRVEASTILAMRKKRQPWKWPSAGCFFKNPFPEKSAGELIDQAGLRGRRVGGAMVSERHANFIVNTGNATASDILALAREIEETVWNRFKVPLEPEVKIIGA